ncbi:MAG: hypothetical protein JWM99_2293 [Verrucomicrobiales bacterium]|nr:hypothetical protein [Verrucomicrobiales bacterium]
MPLSATTPNASTLSEGPLDCFKIVLAYEDQESAGCGLQICNKIAHDLGESFELNKVMWKFDLLNVPKIRQLAAEDAATADMIIFAMHQNADLSGSVCAWIEKALKDASEKPRALVALLSRDCDTQGKPGLGYLRRLAEINRIDFFSNLDGTEESLVLALPA